MVVVVTSSGYAYPTYREGSCTMEVIARRCRAPPPSPLAHDGELIPEGDRERLAGAPRRAFTFTNGVGAAVLARAASARSARREYLVVDTGGTTQVATTSPSRIEPRPDRPRYRTPPPERQGGVDRLGRLPLEYLAPRGYQSAAGASRAPASGVFDARSFALSSRRVSATKLDLFGSRRSGRYAARDRGLRQPRRGPRDRGRAPWARATISRARHRSARGVRLARRRAGPRGGARSSSASAVRGSRCPLRPRRCRRTGIAVASRWLAPELAEVASCWRVPRGARAARGRELSRADTRGLDPRSDGDPRRARRAARHGSRAERDLHVVADPHPCPGYLRRARDRLLPAGRGAPSIARDGSLLPHDGLRVGRRGGRVLRGRPALHHLPRGVASPPR